MMTLIESVEGFVSDGQGALVQMWKGKAKNGSNWISVTKKPGGTFLIEFAYLRGSTFKLLATHERILADQVVDLVRMQTGAR